MKSTLSSAVNTASIIFQTIVHHIFEYVWNIILILNIHMNVLSWILPVQQPSLKLQQKVYSCTLMTSEQPIGGSTDSLMRHTTVQRCRLEMEKFILPYYIPVKPIKTNILEVCIKDENGKEVSFLKKATTCTFHFRNKLWLID